MFEVLRWFAVRSMRVKLGLRLAKVIAAACEMRLKFDVVARLPCYFI